jgi:fatty acid desaturase
MSATNMPAASDFLSPDEIKELGEFDWRGIGSVAWTWGWIFACAALYCAFPSVWSVAITWVVMSGRHLALAILMHEAAHGLLARNRVWNDRIGQWLTAWPTMVDTLAYRRAHFKHHRYTYTEEDPDLDLVKPFPITPRSFRRKMVRDLTGQTGLKRVVLLTRLSCGLPSRGSGLGGISLAEAVRRFAKNQRGFLITNAILLGGFTLAGHPEGYLLVWWLPLLTGYQVVVRLRSMAEHAMVSDPTDPLRQTRTTLAPWWLRFFIAPHHVNYHLEHHLFMFVPHYRLPDAHRLLAQAGVLERAEISPSYAQMLRRIMSRPEGTERVASAGAAA